MKAKPGRKKTSAGRPGKDKPKTAPARPAKRAPVRPAKRAPARPAKRAPVRPAKRAPARPAKRAPARPAKPKLKRPKVRERDYHGQRYGETRTWTVTRVTEVAAIEAAARYLRGFRRRRGPVYVTIFLYVRMRSTPADKRQFSSRLIFRPVKKKGARAVKGYPLTMVNLTEVLFPGNPNVDVRDLPSLNIAQLWSLSGLEAHSLVQIKISAVGRSV